MQHDLGILLLLWFIIIEKFRHTWWSQRASELTRDESQEVLLREIVRLNRIERINPFKWQNNIARYVCERPHPKRAILIRNSVVYLCKRTVDKDRNDIFTLSWIAPVDSNLEIFDSDQPINFFLSVSLNVAFSSIRCRHKHLLSTTEASMNKQDHNLTLQPKF